MRRGAFEGEAARGRRWGKDVFELALGAVRTETETGDEKQKSLKIERMTCLLVETSTHA